MRQSFSPRTGDGQGECPPPLCSSAGGDDLVRIKPRRLAHRVTTAHLQAAYPFISEGGLGSEGVYIGRDVFGGSFCYDCFTLYGREITGPNMLVIGQIGYAKSSLVKTYLWRQMLFGRTAWVIDPKGEYNQLAAFCGTEPIRFRSGGSLRLNPLDPMIGGDAQLALRRMGAGDLRGMFDGPTSRDLDLSGRLVVFNLREVKDEARPILMACTAAWLQGSWARNDGV